MLDSLKLRAGRHLREFIVPWTLQSACQGVDWLQLVHFQRRGAHHLMGQWAPGASYSVKSLFSSGSPRGPCSDRWSHRTVCPLACLLSLSASLLCPLGPQLPRDRSLCRRDRLEGPTSVYLWQERVVGSWEMSGDKSELASGEAQGRSVTLGVSSLISGGEKQAAKGFLWQPPAEQNVLSLPELVPRGWAGRSC